MPITRHSSGTPQPQAPSLPSARALTHREAHLIDSYRAQQPIFIKTAVSLHAQEGPPIIPRSQASASSGSAPASQSSNSPAGSFPKTKTPYIPHAVFLHQKKQQGWKLPTALPKQPLINYDFVGLCTFPTPKIPPLWEASLLFREHSKTCASLGRTQCSLAITREIDATALPKRASSMAAISNLARFAGAFFQFDLTAGLPPEGEDALATVPQWLRHMRERGYTVHRGALCDLRVVNEAV